MKVCVMMSTYNGEKYIQEQIYSILSQNEVSVDLFIRDDGSKDNTANEVEMISKKYPHIHFKQGENIGYAKSFFSLLRDVPNGYDFYAFSDQDDVWKANKLIDAVNMLKEKHTPCLYACNLELVDQDCKYIGFMDAPTMEDFNKGRYLIDKYSYGCTMVFNPELRKLVLNHLPSINISHDNWVGLLAVFCGEFIFDNSPNILYRQHGNNVTGGQSGLIHSWKRRIKNITKLKDESRCLLAKELLNQFETEFDCETIDLLEMVAFYKSSTKSKIRFFLDKRTIRKSKEKNFIFRIMILLSMV